tara:strand:- start:72 stop:350 length:279 start_codon:yes stop_codon:yes gene_type:complete
VVTWLATVCRSQSGCATADSASPAAASTATSGCVTWRTRATSTAKGLQYYFACVSFSRRYVHISSTACRPISGIIRPTTTSGGGTASTNDYI